MSEGLWGLWDGMYLVVMNREVRGMGVSAMPRPTTMN